MPAGTIRTMAWAMRILVGVEDHRDQMISRPSLHGPMRLRWLKGPSDGVIMSLDLKSDSLRRDLKAMLTRVGDLETPQHSEEPFRVVEGDVNGHPFRLSVWLTPRFLRAVCK